MTMDDNLFLNISYRIWTRMAACFQMLILGGTLALLVIFATVTFFSASVRAYTMKCYVDFISLASDVNDDPCTEKVNAFAALTLTVGFCFALFVEAIMVQFWAAFKLFHATYSEVELAKGLKGIQIWRNANFVFLTIDVLVFVTVKNVYIYSVTACFIRAISLAFVRSYKSQLIKENSKYYCFQTIYAPE